MFVSEFNAINHHNKTPVLKGFVISFNYCCTRGSNKFRFRIQWWLQPLPRWRWSSLIEPEFKCVFFLKALHYFTYSIILRVHTRAVANVYHINSFQISLAISHLRSHFYLWGYANHLNPNSNMDALLEVDQHHLVYLVGLFCICYKFHKGPCNIFFISYDTKCFTEFWWNSMEILVSSQMVKSEFEKNPWVFYAILNFLISMTPRCKFIEFNWILSFPFLMAQALSWNASSLATSQSLFDFWDENQIKNNGHIDAVLLINNINMWR